MDIVKLPYTIISSDKMHVKFAGKELDAVKNAQERTTKTGQVHYVYKLIGTTHPMESVWEPYERF